MACCGGYVQLGPASRVTAEVGPFDFRGFLRAHSCAKGPFDLLKLPELGLRVAAFCFRRVMLSSL
jgi:hypothetical protein